MSNQEFEQARLEAENTAIELNVFKAAMLIASDGELNDVPDVDWIQESENWESFKDWEKCTVEAEYGILGTKIDGTVDVKVKLNEDTIIYCASKISNEDTETVTIFRNGAWVERFLAYSKEVRVKYEKQQLDRIQQARSEALKPFSNIDF
ncbi:hypothetical protein [Acinetobacter modestus]|uniref:hypothetical protein n=1 Tax=Acinetobacter modestus TaxID=1776740 RepID=UPI00320A62EE